MKKQRNHPVYMKFAKKAAKSAGADLDVIFHFTSAGMSELTECPGSCHPLNSSLNPSSRAHPAGSWEEGALQVWESFPGSIPNSTARAHWGFGEQRVSGQL